MGIESDSQVINEKVLIAQQSSTIKKAERTHDEKAKKMPIVSSFSG